MPEGRWTPQKVAERLAEAADVLDRLPPPKVRGFYSMLPLLPHVPTGDGARTRRAPLRLRRSTAWTRRSAGCAGWTRGAAARLASGRGPTVEADHLSVWDWPDDSLATVDDRPAQDRDPAERRG